MTLEIHYQKQDIPYTTFVLRTLGFTWRERLQVYI